MTENLTDAEVIIASWSDPARFTLVFERHFSALHGYLHRRVGWPTADDLAAETFARAFDARHRYDPAHSEARPWLYGIAVKLLRQQYRTERRQLLAYARTGLDPVQTDELDSVADRLDACGEGPRLAKALATLNKGERDVLLLFAWAELSYGEIAEALGLPLGTVRSRLSRARDRLRRHLDSGHPSITKPVGAPVRREGLLEARSDENG